jgi:predicted membrane-bound spermidine synthase
MGGTVFAGGMAALSWELLWQHYASLALGASAYGTAVTLATAMGSMCAGALAAAVLLPRWRSSDGHLLHLYGWLEALIGLCGLLLPAAFTALARVDTRLYAFAPALSWWLYLPGNVLIIAPAGFCMGASVPVFGLLARRHRLSLPFLYGANTLGASFGVLAMGFFLIKYLGIETSGHLIVAINLLVALGCLLLQRAFPAATAMPVRGDEIEPTAEPSIASIPLLMQVAVFLTGLATFVLEVAWFRAARAAFQSTTDVFAILLFTVILALAIGSMLAASRWRPRKFSLGLLLLPGCLIMLSTPVIERFDAFRPFPGPYVARVFTWLKLVTPTIGLPILFLGMVLPLALAHGRGVRAWARLYAINTAGAVLGSVLAGWVLLPALGFNRTAWLAGLLLAGAALWSRRGSQLWVGAGLTITCWLIAVAFNSHPGRDRVIGVEGADSKILAYREGPDVTTSVVRIRQTTQLFIDGFSAAGEMSGAEYMDWMGRLPMLLHPAPGNALVICFGTGQTARGVLDENPLHLDLVDINPVVFSMAGYFKQNYDVLADPRVRTVVMDGRAWVRRTATHYDVVTLEPLPPHFAGTNALYSVEFYQAVAGRLNDGAVVAQWLPLHLLTPEHATAIAAAFHEVFPEAILWIEPKCRTGILLGRYHRAFGEETGEFWPGFARTALRRRLSPAAIRAAVALDPAQFRAYAALGMPVTDDNQTLAYGVGKFNHYSLADPVGLNLRVIEAVKNQVTLPGSSSQNK